MPNSNWIVSYDNVSEIQALYTNFPTVAFGLNYSLQEKKKGSELMIFSNGVIIPRFMKIRKNKIDLFANI